MTHCAKEKDKFIAFAHTWELAQGLAYLRIHSIFSAILFLLRAVVHENCSMQGNGNIWIFKEMW